MRAVVMTQVGPDAMVRLAQAAVDQAGLQLTHQGGEHASSRR
eukprot:COSAG01_NODE_12125_length_1797_cov_5.419317_2_plen_42_part_00